MATEIDILVCCKDSTEITRQGEVEHVQIEIYRSDSFIALWNGEWHKINF